MSRIRVAVAATVAALGIAVEARAVDSAAVVMYHRFGDNRYASTNIRLDQFEEHIRELKSGPYKVLPLPEIVAALKEGRALPDRTVAITIDDAFATVYREGWPRLRKAGLPFTFFVATDHLDSGSPEHVTWAQLREMVAGGGVTVGHHAASHASLAQEGPERAKAEIEKANGRFRTELGQVPELFSYPYGETGQAVTQVVRDSGFKAAFGQHSGAFDGKPEWFYLPRFALNETYGTLDRFRQAVNSVALPVADITPVDPLIVGANPPPIGFSVGPVAASLDSLRCFASHEGSVGLIRLGESRVEVRLRKPLPPGRSRLNCTLPAGEGRWHWFGRQYYVPTR
ncbi:MAG: polysaccharide deacetylase family protein [Magnetospirillum sp. WYHS-4]